MAIAGRGYPNVPVIVRGALEDPADFGSKSQVTVIASQPARVQLTVPPFTVVRSTLADPPVLTTPAPVVLAVPYDRRIGAGQAIVIAAPQAQAGSATPPPVVVAAAQDSRWRPGAVAIALRSTLADPAVLTTAGPLLVAAPYDRRWFAPGVLLTAAGSPLAAGPPVAQQGTATVTNVLAATATISNVLAGTVTIVNDL